MAAGQGARSRDLGGLRFGVLGPVEVTGDAGTVLLLGAPRNRALLAALLVPPGAVLSVDRLTDLLWDGAPPPTARTMVHGAVAGLRRVLGAVVPDGSGGPLVTRAEGYALDLRPDQLDATRFENLLTEGRRIAAQTPEHASALFAEALALWRGPALAGIEHRFARAAADRWEALRLTCLEARMTTELSLGHHQEVLPELEDVVRRHPFREELCALLVLALYRCGRQADALAALCAVRRALADELGLEPGPALQTLEQRVLQHSPELQVPRAPVSVAIGRPPPATFSSFVGRDRERSEVAELIAAHRLVTLTGPGGSGKSRLALELAAHLDQPATEVFFADLAPLSTVELVEGALGEALGVRPAPGLTLAEAARSALARRRVVLLIDNCEHLADACAAVVAPLLSAASTLHVVVTTRVALRLPGEHAYPVGPLPTAAPGDGWEGVAACDAVRLFVDRVAAVRRGFTVTEHNAAAVLQICRRLDGLPLALELVAARASSLPLADLASRLQDGVSLVAAGHRPVDDVRHRSLTATMAWSFDLLSEPQQRLFARISVFPAAFSLAAVEDVASDEGLPRADVGSLLAGLVESSTVDLADEPDGRSRYRTLETTRQFGRGLLDDSALAALRRRHAEHYLQLAETAGPHLFRAGSAVWLDRLDAERDHLRAALDWAFGARGEPGLGARLVGCLWHLWDLRGARQEGLHWVDAALRATSAEQVAERLAVLAAGALLHLGRAEFDAVATLAGEARELARRIGDRAAEGDALALEATVAWARGAFDRAGHLYEDGIALSLAGGDVWGASLAESQLARLHRDRDEPDAALAVVLRARGHAEEVGEDLARGLAADVHASVEHRWGDQFVARDLVEDAMAHYRAVGYLEGEASALCLRARVEEESGDRDRAAADFGRSLELCRRIGLRGGSAAALEGLASVSSGADDLRALELLEAASTLRAEIGSPLTGASGRDVVRLRQLIDRRLAAD